ncbi:MAG: diphosphomevalonate decarboxylase [Candidatus Aenigmarchaeota archaeon]|nr:diphosphomevalonate decarboxylase [Candidatus Aenigmarchaeota archaeon]
MALVKYWGKRDTGLMLPKNGSISMTTDGLFAHTTVEFNPSFKEDKFIFNGLLQDTTTDAYKEYVGFFLGLVRKMTKNKDKVKISSNNNFPTAAGLASSAAGFAALAAAVNGALGLGLNEKELSMLARRGSGSATRSISGGFVEWKRGEKEDGTDSYGEQIVPPDYWQDFRMLFCITSLKEKKVKSRAGMSQTLKTSPMYPGWLSTVGEDLNKVRQGIKDRNFTVVGRTAEENCLKMHSTMITTKPSIIYWKPETVKLMHAVMDWRDDGLESYFTMDAGPQVKIMCLEKDLEEIKGRVQKLGITEEIIVSKPGSGVKLTGEHLF